MRFYFPQDPRISRAMERIRQAFIRYAPPGTEWVQNPQPDAIHVLHWVSQNPREHHPQDEILQAAPTLPLSSRFIVILHMGNWFWPQYENEFKQLMARARLIITVDKGLLPWDASNLMETPWGFEPSTFYHVPGPKFWTILATGYVAASEAIDSIFDACYRARLSMVHVGGKILNAWQPPTYTRFEDIPDFRMRELYNASRFVSGLRREGGFELPTIEGYACGGQPICFDLPCFRRWFNDFALFVSILPREELTQALIPVLTRPLNLQPLPEILGRFHWSTLMPKIYSRISECV